MPLKDLRFRCTRCGSSRFTDSVVMARDALRVRPWRATCTQADGVS
jgi:hypothetical protein